MPAKDQKAYGKAYYQNNTEACKLNTTQRRKRIRLWLQEYKKTLHCIKCGNTDHRVLQFHHLRDKSFEIWKSISMGKSIERIKEEIDKCAVLCANCHCIEHWQEVHIE